MLIGLISDIHGELPEQVHQVFEGVDRRYTEYAKSL